MAASSSDSGHSSGSGGGGHGGHHYGDETGLVFLIIAVGMGAAVAHGLSRVAPWMPYTPTLLMVGVLTASLDQVLEVDHVRQSLERWEAFDGHLLLFVFLPPLLFADCMHLQWTLIRRCVAQCCVLAGPGVVLGAVLNAIFARYVLPYGWSWNLALSYGAVQAATDPVAVVALLNELGAPPSLTMIISGESLLNDGTAIVVWKFFFDQLQVHEPPGLAA